MLEEIKYEEKNFNKIVNILSSAVFQNKGKMIIQTSSMEKINKGKMQLKITEIEAGLFVELIENGNIN